MMYENMVLELRKAADEWRANHLSVPTFETRYDLALKDAADAIENTSKAYQMMAEAYEAEVTMSRWIPVEERLPEDERDVLVCYGFTHDGVMTERRFIGVIEYFAFDAVPHWQHESTGLTVTHWMPLPEPPKEET